MQAITEAFFYIWELPQNLLGLVLSKIIWRGNLALLTADTLKRHHGLEGITAKKVCLVRRTYFKSLCSFSLGRYVFIKAEDFFDTYTIKHECTGHSIQSRRYGWLYLLTVGLVSALRNIYRRVKNKDSGWYYGGWPENEADRLAGVKRGERG